MDLATLGLMRCPMCRGILEVAHRRAVSPTGRLRDGLLGCRTCARRYPVMHWIPRMLPRERLTEAERLAADVLALNPDLESVADAGLPPEERRREIERRLRSKHLPAGLLDRLLAPAADGEVVDLGLAKDGNELLRALLGRMTRGPESILEVGGGANGILPAFSRHLRPRHAFLVDLDPDWAEVAQIRDPEAAVIRADALHLPFPDGALDLLLTADMLERLPKWKGALREFVRVSHEGLVTYGPNRRFPVDFTHLDAPLVTWLPAGPAVGLAWLHHRLRHTGRTLASLREELKGLSYIPRTRAAGELGRLGCMVTNVFRDYSAHTLRRTGGSRGTGLLRRLPWLHGFGTRLLVLLAAEPRVYLYYRRAEETRSLCARRAS